MANLQQKIARIDVLIGGVPAAKSHLQELKEQAAKLNDELKKLRKDRDAATDTVDYDKANLQVKQREKELQRTNKAIRDTEANIKTVETYLHDITSLSLKELNTAGKQLRQMLSAIKPDPANTKQLSTVRDMIQQVGDEMKRRKGELVEYSDVMNNLGGVSDRALSMARQRLQDLAATTEQGSDKLRQYQEQLQRIQQEQQRRTDQRGQATLDSLRSTATYDDRTHAQTGGNTTAQKVAELNARQLEEARRALEEYKKSLAGTDDKKLREVEQTLQHIRVAEERVRQGNVDIQHTLDNLDHASMNDLQRAAAQLQAELNNCERGTRQYVERSAELRRVRQQIDDTTRTMNAHSTSIQDVAKRLTAYVAVYGSFNFIKGKITDFIRDNARLTDSLSDVRKTTGLTTDEVRRLALQIDAIDTRTSQEQLLKLAESGGRLGIKGVDGVLGYVKAANQLQVALVELGTEGTTELMKLATITGEADRLGIERSLLSIGSAINVLSVNSPAAAGPIVDLMARMGGVANSAGLASHEIAAIGATVDALGQSAEVAGTSFNKFIPALMTNSEKIAYDLDLDYRKMKDMLDMGRTMDAMVMVLEGMRQKGGISENIGFMKDFGSEGARMSALLTTMATNVDMFKHQLDLSRDAFVQATSATNEYNLKNENAQALLERTSNLWQEYWVNANNQGSMQRVALFLHDLSQWLTTTSGGTSALGAVAGAVISGVAVGLLRLNTLSLGLHATWVRFTTMMKANWVGMLVTAIGAIVGALSSMKRESNAAADASERFFTRTQEETFKVNALFDALQKANQGSEEYNRLRTQIQRNYGAYLASMGEEVRSLRDIEGARRAVTAAIMQQVKAEAAQAGAKSAMTGYLERTKENYENLYKAITSDVRYQQEGAAQKLLDELRSYLDRGEQLPQQLQQLIDSFSGTFKNGLLEYDTHRYIQIQLDGIRKEGANLKSETEKVKQQYGDFVDGLLQKEDQLSGSFGRAATLKGWREMLDNMNDISKVTVDDLTALYKAMEDGGKRIGFDVEEYNKTFGTQFKTLDQAHQQVFQNAKRVRDRLKELHRNTSGGFDFGGGKDGGASSERERINKEYEAALAALEAYYNKREAMIAAQRVKSMEAARRGNSEAVMTEAQYNEQLRALDVEKLADRATLRKNLLRYVEQEYRDAHLDTAKYVIGQQNFFEGKDLDKLAKELQRFGAALTDGILKNLTADELKILEQTVKHQQAIQRILLDDDYVGKTRQNHQQQLEELDLFWAATELRTDRAATTRLEQLQHLARMSYQLNADSLAAQMQQDEAFAAWRQGKTAQDYEALLILLRKFNDDVEEAENKQRDRKLRIINKQWSVSDEQQANEQQSRTDKDQVALAGRLEQLGIGSEMLTQDLEIEQYRNKLEAAREYYEYVQRAGGDTTAAMQRYNEAQQELAQQEEEMTQLKMERLKGYTDAVVEFSGQMGEAAFGELADRQAAAKQLLKTTLQLTKDLILDETKRLIMKQALKQKEVVLEQTTEATKTEIQGQSAITNLTVQQATTQAQTQAGISSGSAQTIGQLGWWGIPLIAVISAALSALMGLAMGALDKSKNEVAAATGVSKGKGRVAAGMLTYAEGDYPVLGNDGVVYNATYHDQLKTGVYQGGTNGRAHFGLFSEKKPEMIVDGDTTQRLIFNYPHIYRAITTIAEHGRLTEAAQPMRTYAAGDYPAALAPAAAMTAADGAQLLAPAAQTDPQMLATLDALTQTVAALNERLQQPIAAAINPMEQGGQSVKNLEQSRAWLQKYGQI